MRIVRALTAWLRRRALVRAAAKAESIAAELDPARRGLVLFDGHAAATAKRKAG